jgi:Mce-associated membrane protein
VSAGLDITVDPGLDEAVGGAGVTVPEPPATAEWSARAAALAIDVVFGLAAVACLLMVAWSAREGGWLWWVCVLLAAAVLVAVGVNRLLLPSVTGWSVGRAVTGIVVTDPRTPGTPLSPWRLLLRDVAHVLDTVPLLAGWLWPLVDRRGRTFADVLAGTEVRPSHGVAPDRRRAARVVAAAAAALSILAAALGYALVERRVQAVADARAQIADEGPRIVTDLLSYTAATADDDFAAAQGLVTESYRPELVAEQDSVRKAGLVDNDYWVTNSAVLSAAPDRASLLLLLQGQRGVPPNQRFLTASVVVGFARAAAGGWQIADLTVLTPSRPAASGAPPPEATPRPGPAPAAEGGGR